MHDSKTVLKTYSSPTLKSLTPEQAKLLLLGQASQGDQGAKDLLDVLFPDPHSRAMFSPSEGKRPGGAMTRNTSRASRFILRASMIRETVRQSFLRLVRG